MSEANRSVDQNGVLDDVRRALGRSVTEPPLPLAPFIEPIDRTDFTDLIGRFTEEATAVRAQVHYISDRLQFVAGGVEQSTTEPADKQNFVGQISERVAQICAAYKGQEIALSGAELFAAIDELAVAFRVQAESCGNRRDAILDFVQRLHRQRLRLARRRQVAQVQPTVELD